MQARRLRPQRLWGARALLALLILGCAGSIERPALDPPEASERLDSLATSIEELAAGFTNLGRLAAVRRRAEELGLGDRVRTEWIDWFSVQQNVMIEVRGRTRQLVYVVAHYDKVDIQPLTLVSVLLNGLLDPIISPLFTSRGAIDNGTGVAVALELGRALAQRENQYTYRILLVGGEESGLRGSRAHVARLPRQEKDDIALAVVLDTVGVRGLQNCVLDVSDPAYTKRARDAAALIGQPLGFGGLPAGASSDFEPFQYDSFFSDFVRGLKFNAVGGLLPQRSWFTGHHEAPVLFFSVCDLLDYGDLASGLFLLPVGRLHGPRDRLSQVDPTRLYQQYAIALRMFEELEKSESFGN